MNDVDKNLIIFDMDGVLVDVSNSYREVVRQSVILYLKEVLGVEADNYNWITLEHVDRVKKSGGLNNDWDLTYTIINCILVSCFDEENHKAAGKFLKISSLSSDEEVRKNVERLKSELNKDGLLRCLETGNIVDFCENTKDKDDISPFLLNKRDIFHGNIIKRIFQELYLGKNLFYEIYSTDPIFYKNSSGYIENEKLIPDIKDIESLNRYSKLAIATGRPAVEAYYAIKRFNIEGFFSVVVTEDDIQKAEAVEHSSLRKPDPFIINECISRLGFNNFDKTKIYYIGDMPDDMVAAKRAGIVPVGFIYPEGKSLTDIEEHKRVLKKAGAKFIIDSFKELISLIKKAF